MLCGNCFTEIENNKICSHCGFDKAVAAEGKKCLPLGVVLRNRFFIGRVLGIGGFSITYKAYDQLLEQIVAVKEYIPNEFSTRMPSQLEITVYTGYKEEQFRAGRKHFVEESRKLAKFQYNNEAVVKVYDCFDENGTSYIVMEYVEGKTIAQILREDGRIMVECAVGITVDILEALEKVHALGIIHRDISPDNMILQKDGRVKLIDFGAAKYASTIYSKSLSMIIKPGYAPMEQYLSNGGQGTWTDVYGVAATLYKMITGVTPPDALERAEKDELRRPSRMGIKIRRQTENALMNALNVPVDGRTQTADLFRRQLLADKVKRRKVKAKREDTGKLGIKAVITGGLLLTAVIGGFILIRSDILQYPVAALQSVVLTEGKTRVPNLINMDLESAQKLTKTQELLFVITDKEYSADIPKDKVLLQSLAAGSIVEKQTSFEVTVSGGKEEADIPAVGADEMLIPDVQYKTEEEAVASLEEAGAEVVLRYEVSDIVESGHVISQDVEAGSVVKKGETVTLTICRRQTATKEQQPETPVRTQEMQSLGNVQSQTMEAQPQPEQQTTDDTVQDGEWQTNYEIDW